MRKALITGIIGQDGAYLTEFLAGKGTRCMASLYGPVDNYHPEYSHVLPAWIRKVYEAKRRNADQVVVWGDKDAAAGVPL